MRWRTLRSGGPLLLSLLAACASTSGRAEGEAAGAAGEANATAVIVVENTASPGRGISVELDSGAGDRRLLGSVGPRRTETFEIDGLRTGVSYRLVAGLIGSGTVASDRFAIAPGAIITWTLPLNTIRTSP